MAVRLQTLFSILLACAFFAGCGSAQSDNTKLKSGSPYNGEFGKAGPGDGESCYLKTTSTDLRCADAPTSDKGAVELLNKACLRLSGQMFSAPCTRENLLGTCDHLKQAPTIVIRYYKTWDKFDAEDDCGTNFEGVLNTSF